MKNIKNKEYTGKRIDSLIKLGFDVIDEDSIVKVFIDCEKLRYVIVDFSAIHEDYFLSYAFSKVYEAGKLDQKEETKNNIRELLGINE